MKEIILGIAGLGAIGAGGFYWASPSDASGTYQLAAGDVEARLLQAPVNTGKGGPFFGQSAYVTAPSDGLVLYEIRNEQMPYSCSATITAVSDKVSKVSTSCGLGGETQLADGAGAIDSAPLKYAEIGLAEFVDATLTGKPFNAARYQQKIIAHGFKNLGKMQKEALSAASEFDEEFVAGPEMNAAEASAALQDMGSNETQSIEAQEAEDADWGAGTE